MNTDPRSEVALKRSLNLPLMVFYGLGTVLGAGIYALIGTVAAAAGMAAIWSFILAAPVAILTAATYAELSMRLPFSGGAAVYADEAFNSRILTVVVGFAVILTGIVSAATMSRGFANYLPVLLPVPASLAISGLIIVMAALAIWGIRESVITIAVVTCIEIGGLLLVVALAGDSLGTLPERWPEMLPTGAGFGGLITGTVLAFYAFIGFEDMVNVAEEVKDPHRTMPRAIFITLVTATVLYVLVALTAVLALPLATLAGHPAPLAAILQQRGPAYGSLISLISIVAVINGALVQIIMAARILYGMGKQYSGLSRFARLHPARRTPVLATLLVAGCVLGFALWLPLKQLAVLTSLILLMVFTLTHAALIRIKAMDRTEPGLCPRWLPWLGLLLCMGLLLGAVYSVLDSR
jgi:basic amino acid/polyamine antiporter, APA family